MSEATNWKVELYPEEKAFIDEVFNRIMEQEDGRGRFIAPIRGGVIHIDEEYDGFTEDQQKWLVFVRLVSNPDHLHSGFKGMKFMNFNYNGDIPQVGEDPEAQDKWGTRRMTTDGQPVGDSGYPIFTIIREQKTTQTFEWNPETKEYRKGDSYVIGDIVFSDSGDSVPEKLVE